jgi:hypothetical protein
MILTKLSVEPSEKIFCKITGYPEIVNVRFAIITPYPTDLVVSLLRTMKPE